MSKTTYQRRVDETMAAFRRALPVNGERVSVREDVLDRVADRMLRDVERADRAEGRPPVGPRAEGFEGDPYDGLSPADAFDGLTGLQGRSPCASDFGRTRGGAQ